MSHAAWPERPRTPRGAFGAAQSVDAANWSAPQARIPEEFFRGLAAIIDVVTVATLSLAATVCYLYLIAEEPVSLLQYLAATLLAAMLLSQQLAVGGAYELERLNNMRYQVQKVLIAWTTVVGVIVAISFLLKISAEFSRVWLVSWYLTTALALICTRYWAAIALRSWIGSGHCFHTIVVIGAGDLGRRFVEAVLSKPGSGLRIEAIFDDRASRCRSSICGIPVVGGVDELAPYVRQSPADMVVIALPLSADQRILDLVRQIRMLPIDVRLLSDAAGFRFSDRTFSRPAGIPAINVADRPIAGWHSVAKRAMDVTVGTIALLALTPLFVLTALLIKLDSPGPVLFRQPRLGFNNRIFSIYKFRTMRVEGADIAAERLVTRGDGRVTRVGRLLRRTSIDELPQLWNVIIGNMSLVGPRPHALRAKAADQPYDEVVAEYAARHRVKPGMTGWAQVNGWRGETDTVEKIRKRVEHDLYYIENWSVQFDFWILIKTAFVAFSARNAY
jgi:Undecaprenyl-phosphate glucose phosphotransferase